MLSYSHEVFFEVATHLSFSKAADILYISQPAITKHIQSLEKHYKISLFERKGNSVSLTSEGKILLEYVVKGRELQRQLEFDISKQKDLQLRPKLGSERCFPCCGYRCDVRRHR